MIVFLQIDENFTWMAPYAYVIVLLGFAFFLFRVFENYYASAFDRPLYRHYFVFRKLNAEQKRVLIEEVDIYKRLTDKEKKQFEHRVATFIEEKRFVGRQELEVTERMKVLIAAMGCMLSFGRKNYVYGLIDYILVYPEEFYSYMNDAYHKGEFNPREKALVISWPDFEKGFKINNDNLNLGLHEFMHAMQLEARRRSDLDSSRFAKQFQNILKRLTNEEVKEKLDDTKFFRAYAFTNQYEFMAVLAEYFFESPNDFKTHFPKLYNYTQKLLNFRFGGY